MGDTFEEPCTIVDLISLNLDFGLSNNYYYCIYGFFLDLLLSLLLLLLELLFLDWVLSNLEELEYLDSWVLAGSLCAFIKVLFGGIKLIEYIYKLYN